MILKRLSLVLVLVVVLAGLVLPCFAESVNYEYDNLYRLIKATYSDGTVIEYTYDAAGNRHSVIKIPPAQAPTVAISANPASIEYGTSSTLTWTSTNATSCAIDQGIGTVPVSGSITITLAATATYTITATGPGGTATASVTVQVAPPPAPRVHLSAHPRRIRQGQSATLTWHSRNAETCDIQPGIGAVGTSGSMSVSPTATTTYMITATGPGGSASDSVTITVIPPRPTVTLSADPRSIRRGDSATLSWQSTNADRAFIRPRIGEVPATGSMTITPTRTTQYTITVIGPGGRTRASITIRVRLR